VSAPPDFRVGLHRLSVQKVAGRWTATVDGRLMPGFFGTEAQAAGAALLLATGRDRDLDALGTGDTLAFQPMAR
jgi:hypothetical protein